MNKEWSTINKEMQTLISKEASYGAGVEVLLSLRDMLMRELISLKTELRREQFDEMPFINEEGYHNKNLAYSIWHIFRIEDIVVHTLIRNDKQVFFSQDFQNRIHSKIITTGNELIKEEISEFTKTLDLEQLYAYAIAVKESTDKIIKELSYKDIKRKISEQQKEELKSLAVVSEDDKAVWLIDYWCNKDVRGLIKMPLSRHWIMHIEAMLRISRKVGKSER